VEDIGSVMLVGILLGVVAIVVIETAEVAEDAIGAVCSSDGGTKVQAIYVFNTPFYRYQQGDCLYAVCNVFWTVRILRGTSIGRISAGYRIAHLRSWTLVNTVEDRGYKDC
jgi:hypothetical protein